MMHALIENNAITALRDAPAGGACALTAATKETP